MDCVQRKIVVRPCPTTIYSCFEGFSDDHFAVTLKPLCGERGIRTPGTSQFNGFQDRRNRPLCHLSMVNFTPPKAHPQGRVGGLTDAKIVYFGEFARVDLQEWTYRRGQCLPREAGREGRVVGPAATPARWGSCTFVRRPRDCGHSTSPNTLCNSYE